MKERLINFQFEKIQTKTIQLICLLLAGIMLFITILFGGHMNYASQDLLQFLLVVVAMIELGVTLRQPMTRTARNLILLGGIFCAWPILLQLLDLRFLLDEDFFYGRFSRSTLLCEYLLLLPFASVSDQDSRIKGLKIIGFSFSGAGLVLTVWVAMLYLRIVPDFLSPILYWKGPRLYAAWNANFMGYIFMVSIGLNLMLAGIFKKAWVRAVLILIALVEFLPLSLTNSWTCIAMAGCLLGGTAFSLFRRKKQDALHTILGLAAGAVILMIVCFGAGELFKLHTEYFYANPDRFILQTSQAAPEAIDQSASEDKKEEQDQPKENGMTKEDEEYFEYRTTVKHLSGLGGRTKIWRASLESLKANPKVLLVGSRQVNLLISSYSERYWDHAHNAWLQTLLVEGIVGFVLVLWITWLAVKNFVLLLFCRKARMYQKIGAILTICMLGTQVFEISLFISDYPLSFMNMIFVFCLGYTVCWGKEAEPLRKK